MEQTKLKPIPIIGKRYHFFDDGKCSDSRHYIATCKKKISPAEAKKLILNRGDGTPMSLYDIWKEEIANCDFLYSNDTDLFVCCRVDKYDENDLWFVRTKDGGWFSLNVQSWWQSGRLDVDSSMFNYYESANGFGHGYYKERI